MEPSDNFFLQISDNDSDAIEFFEGFADAYGLSDAADILIKCAQSDAPDTFDDLHEVIEDLKSKNFTGAIGEMIEFFKAVGNLRNVCADGADPFLTKFDPAIQAYEQNRDQFYADVTKDLAANVTGTFTDTIRLALDLHGDNYEAAGQDFGDLLGIGLSIWLNPSNDLFLLQTTEEADSDLGSGTSTDAENFFEGFANTFGLETAAKSLIACAYTDPNNLITDIQTLINDIQNSKWTNVIQDGIQILNDIQDMESDCPAGANPFMNEFQPVVNAWNSNQQQFLDEVGDNCKDNLGPLMGEVGQMIEDFNNSDYSDAGAQFGDAINVALKGIISS
jgi:hypothetical protein